MPTEIPRDLWVLVTQLIPEQHLWDLRSLNSAFFQAAMDVRYRSGTIFDCHVSKRGWWEETLGHWEKLRQPHIAPRVRRVIVKAWWLDRHFASCVPRKMADGRVQGTYPHSSDSDQSANSALDGFPESFDQYSRSLFDTLACFTNTTEYEVHWADLCHIHTVQILSRIWLCLGPRLQTLLWDSPLRNFHLLLVESSLVQFPVLKNLSLKLYRPVDQCQYDDERIRTSIGPFLKRHSTTIQSLSAPHVTQFSPPLDPTIVFPLAGYCPRIQRLSFAFGIPSHKHIQALDPDALAQFLESHATTLRHLSISLSCLHNNPVRRVHDIDDAFDRMFNLNLSQLEILEFSFKHFCHMSVLKTTVLATASRFADTLTTLVIDTICNTAALSYNQVLDLLSAFSRRPTSPRLSTLLLSVGTLSPDLVDSISSALPGLLELTIKFRAIRLNESDASLSNLQDPSKAFDSINSFDEEMQKRVYSDWSLRYLSAQTICPPEHCTRAGKIIAERIPHAYHFLVEGDRPYRMKRGINGAVSWERFLLLLDKSSDSSQHLRNLSCAFTIRHGLHLALG